MRECVHEEVRKQLSGGHFSAFYQEFGGHTKVIGLEHQGLNLQDPRLSMQPLKLNTLRPFCRFYKGPF